MQVLKKILNKKIVVNVKMKARKMMWANKLLQK